MATSPALILQRVVNCTLLHVVARCCTVAQRPRAGDMLDDSARAPVTGFESLAHVVTLLHETRLGQVLCGKTGLFW